MILGISACTTTQKPVDERVEVPDWDSTPDPESLLPSKLGMIRAPDELGFAEKRFNPCQYGLKADTSGCSTKFLTVVHFQLLCRDSEGTVSEVPVDLMPLISDRVEWKIGDRTGGTHTDGQGYGQFTLVSAKSARGQRLMLRIGKQFMGFTASELTKVVLPRNFCS